MSWLRPSRVGRVGCLSINARYFPRDREGLDIYRVWFMKAMPFDMSTAHFAFTAISIIPRRVLYKKKGNEVVTKWQLYSQYFLWLHQREEFISREAICATAVLLIRRIVGNFSNSKDPRFGIMPPETTLSRYSLLLARHRGGFRAHRYGSHV